MAPKQKVKSPMSEAHKDALRRGREEGRIVAEYLNAIDVYKETILKLSELHNSKNGKISGEAQPQS